jgi:2,4-dienoyl-CoA reductase-like NADH-dependent reductase (Old Yellow Enzyme family)/thioredoxin reductase
MLVGGKEEVASPFKNLFAPIELGPIAVRNRIFVTPHATMFASDDRNNLPGERLAYYCAERAKGGVGLIEVSMGIVSAETSSQTAPDTDAHFSPLSGGHPMILTGRWPLRANDPRIVDGYSRLARMVHMHGAKCFIELASGGTNVGSELGVSSFPWPYSLPFTPREMDERDIENSIESYGKAAKYVKEAGLDGIDLHGTHGALISEFLSGVMNRRKDKYGGSLQSRVRFPLEVIQRVREYVGGEIAVGMRLMGDERFKGGNTPKEAAEIAQYLDGKIDWITADLGYSPQQEDWQAVPMYVDSGYNLQITSPIKASVKKTKVGVVGRYVDPYFAERLISQGLADMVAMTRAMIADPELPKKAMEGRVEDIRPCIGVLQDCWGRMIRGLPISCTVNPIVSREKEWGTGSIKEASIKKKVLVIGAGPAGLETARVAAERGHDVVIYEKSRQVGGQALLAAKLPGRADIKAIINWEANQIKKLGVEVKYGLEVISDPEVLRFLLNEEKPDSVVIATGSIPIRNGFQPYNFEEVEGWEEPIVCTDVDVLQESSKINLGRNIIIADTIGFIEAPGIAELLANQGRNVEVVTYHANLGLDLKLINHWEHVLPRLFKAKVKVSPFTWIKKISSNNVTLYNVYYKEYEREVENVDNVILITGKMQNDSLYSALRDKVKELYLVGDANIGGARIGNAMYDGQKVGRAI